MCMDYRAQSYGTTKEGDSNAVSLLQQKVENVCNGQTYQSVVCVCECMCVDRFVHTSDVIHTILYIVVPIRHLASFFLLASWY